MTLFNLIKVLAQSSYYIELCFFSKERFGCEEHQKKFFLFGALWFYILFLILR